MPSSQRNNHLDNSTASGARAATIEYSRAALNLINRNLQALQQQQQQQQTIQSHGDDLASTSRDINHQTEWYFRVADMLSDTHPGYILSDSEQNQLCHRPQNKNRGHRVIPTCCQCGSIIFPGTTYTKCRISSNSKRKRKRQPKKKKQGQGNGRELEGIFADHPDLQIPDTKASKNTMKLECRLCGNRCTIPALDRSHKEHNGKEKQLKRQESIPMKEEAVTEAENPEFIPLGEVKPAPKRFPSKLQDKQVLLPLQKSKKKPKKKKPKTNSSQLHDFLSSLND